jgi:hypothetical protein
MVALARAGLFTEADAREAPQEAMSRWFERVPDGWHAKDELRAVTQFEVGDLLRIRRLSASYDLILCRNTVIYFTDTIRDELHARLAHSLRPGGYLVVGGTERVTDPRSNSCPSIRSPTAGRPRWIRRSTSRCSSLRRASTSRSSTSPSFASRSSPTIARPSTRSFASRIR